MMCWQVTGSFLPCAFLWRHTDGWDSDNGLDERMTASQQPANPSIPPSTHISMQSRSWSPGVSSRSRPDLPKASLPEPSRIPIRTRKPLRGPVLQYHSSTTLLLVHTLLSTSTPAATAAGDKRRCVPRAPLHPDASLCAHDPKTSFHTMIILMFPTRCYCCATHAQQTWSMSYRFEGVTHSTKVLSA